MSRKSAPALPSDPSAEVGGRPLSEIIQSKFLPAEYADISELIMDDEWLLRSAKQMADLHNKLKITDSTYDNYEMFIVANYSPLNSEASIRKLAHDLQEWYENEKRQMYFKKANNDVSGRQFEKKNLPAQKAYRLP